MSSRAAYTPPPPTQLTSSPGRSSHVRVRPTAAASAAKVPAPPRLPRESQPVAKREPALRLAKKPAQAKLAKAPAPAKVAKKPVQAKVAKKPVQAKVAKAPAQAKVAKKNPPPRVARAATPSLPPPASAARALLTHVRASTASDLESDTVEMDPPIVEERTEEMPVPELHAAEAHRKLAAREKRQKKLVRARVNETRGRQTKTEPMANEKSGIRKKVSQSGVPVTQRKSAPPPVPASARKPSVAPPPVPAAAQAKRVPPPPPKRVAPPPPRTSLAAFTAPAAPTPAPTPAAAPARPVAKVLHIPSREATQQFALPRREASTAAQVIPLSRVAPNDIAVPLVPTMPMPLTQARTAAAGPTSQAAFAAAPASMRQDTQQILLAAPAPFVGEDPDEDLLAPYTVSPLRALSKALSTFFED